MELDRNKKIAVAVMIVALFLLAAVWVLFTSFGPTVTTGEATLADLLSSTSERSGEAPTAAVSGDDPLYALAATPVCQFYDGERQRHISPMLIYTEQPQMHTNPSNDLLKHYSSDELIEVGDASGLSFEPDRVFPGAVKYASIAMAREYWVQSDGAILVSDDQDGYNAAVSVTTLGCYVNIPVIVSPSLDGDVRGCLESLGVKYTIVCGTNISGYGRVMRLDTPVEAQDMTLAFITDPEGMATRPDYLSIANPLDAYPPATELLDEQSYTGEVFHIYTPGPGAYAGLEQSGNGVDFPYEVPDDTLNGILRLRLSIKPHEQDEIDGERVYCFVYYEDPDDGWIEPYYFGTCGGRKEGAYEVIDFDVPVLGATGNYKFHVEGRNTYDTGNGNLVTKKPVPFELGVRLESMSSPIYPNMESLSSIAPYQCASHAGVLMASPGYASQYPQLGNFSGAFDPTICADAHDYVNGQAWKIHDQELVLLGKMMGWDDPQGIPADIDRTVDLADALYDDPVYVCVVADTNMVPHIYHEGETMGPSEGMGQPGDLIYSDVDMGRSDPFIDLGEGIVESGVQDYELPEGRIVGYDAMDASALMCRAIFYYDIIDSFLGHDQDKDNSWKNNGYVFLGSKMPVESMYGTYVRDVKDFMEDGGFDMIGTTEERSDYKFAHQYQEGSNYILGGVHGNYYWYVPQAHSSAIAGGSAYDVTNTLEMTMGPSTMFLVSCITGRIDGLAPESCLSMAYIHIGVASYVGATRSTLGFVTPDMEFDMRLLEPEGAVLLSEYYAKALLEDKSTGMALRDAKNEYLPHDLSGGGITDESFIMVQHYMLYGDPAFDPYEPANG